MRRSNRFPGMNLVTLLALVCASPAAPAQFTMSDVDVTACGGSFTDSGGPDGAYVGGENFVKTFTPSTPGTWLRFDFFSFNVESSHSCLDFLAIYDGPDTSSPVIGAWCNLRGSPGRVTSSHPTGAVTFEFTSGGSGGTHSGWEAEITCVSNPKNPAEFCHGNGGNLSGCTICPCVLAVFLQPNDPGGCPNTANRQARALHSGSTSTSISSSDLRFEATGLPPFVNAILISGAELAPLGAANPCFGTATGVTSTSLDGLRCVVQGVLRHGVRVADLQGNVGATTPGWGVPDTFANFASFVSGGKRHFQIIYRDNPTTCMGTGQNSTQAVSVLFRP